MILVCPACGAAASLEAWKNDRDWRELLALVPAVPAALQSRAISYLGLFRKAGKALKPSKALKILGELRDLTASGKVQWENGEVRPAPVELWIQALDAVLDRNPKELANHNYLRHTAWDMAGPLAAKAERETERKKVVSREVAKARSEEEAKKEPGKKAQSCFRCAHFRPPTKCSEGHHPPGGNMAWGCGQHWVEKTAGAGDLMGGLAARLTEGLQSKLPDGESDER
ncbi:MAG: hypothetical protein AB9866_11010 [Syntrophobacteraceae bacterium]